MSEQQPESTRATIFKIQRMSTEDGPGIRTTVFFKGCPLRCTWCHNPESISPYAQLVWWQSKCMACHTCIEVCTENALTAEPSGITIHRDQCTACGDCVAECPSAALEMHGESWELADLLAEVEKDRAYFESSGGGITVSGGEPTMQARFVAALLQACKERGLSTAMDTCGHCSEQALDMLLPHCDLVLFDIKEIDRDKHKALTGTTNETILERLVQVRDHMLRSRSPKRLWLRTPIIPDATAAEENVRGIGRFVSEILGDLVSRWELCAFNNYCMDKYVRLGLDWPFREHPLLGKAVMERLVGVAKSSGVDPEVVLWTGETKAGDDQRRSE